MSEMGMYKCNVCGNVVSMVVTGVGTLVCCGQDMEFLKPKTIAEEGKEKHVPVIEKSSKGVKVKVGSVPHPMEDKHWIVAVELMKGGKKVGCARLYPGDAPEAEFAVEHSDDLVAREYCNVHGLWTS